MSADISELSSRFDDGVEVALLWQPCDNTAFVAVVDHRSGEDFVLNVHENDNALDMFHHPYAYAAQRHIDQRWGAITLGGHAARSRAATAHATQTLR